MKSPQPQVSEAEHDLSAEEAHQKARHEELYRLERGAVAAYSPHDWQKFEAIRSPIEPYSASVLRLGDVRGKYVLDLGCGDGWFSVLLAKRGARVFGCDISEEAIVTARERARVNGVLEQCTFSACSAYELPCEDSSFDIAAGHAILHHLEDKARTAQSIYRVLKPGGIGVFREPFGNSLMLERMRLLVPVPSMSDDPGEWKMQFKYSDLAPFRALFDVEVEEWQLVSRLDRLFKSARAKEALWRFDVGLLKYNKWLRRYARAILVKLKKPVAQNATG
jgi:2-polyprenyl-3-methyl-5-hydroxy-6-metoxy-1,4-benzoquinol methylase